MGRPKKTIKEKITEAKGLGDVVSIITSTLGIPECQSCAERRQKLNDMFSFLKSVRRDLTSEEVEFIKKCSQDNRIPDTAKFTKIYNEIFGTHIQNCSCGGLHKELLIKLMKQIEKQEITSDDNNQEKE